MKNPTTGIIIPYKKPKGKMFTARATMENGEWINIAEILDLMSRSDFNLLLNLGLIDGMSPVSLSATVIDITSGEVTLWSPSTRYSFPTTDDYLTITSTSIEDDYLTGEGLHRIVIRGLDINYEPINEVVYLTGTTPVSTVNKFFRVNEVNVEESGNLYNTAGTINVKMGSNLLAVVESNRNISRQGVFTVPAGFTALVEFHTISAVKGHEGIARIYVTNPINHIPIEQLSQPYYQNIGNMINGIYIKALEKHDLDLTAELTGAVGNATITCWTSIILVQNEEQV